MKIRELLEKILESYSGKFGQLELSKILSGNIILDDKEINSYVKIFKNYSTSRINAILKKAIDEGIIINYHDKLYSKVCYRIIKGQKINLQKIHKFFIELEKKYNFQGFFHTTSFDNFIKIYKTGKLCSRNYLINNNSDFDDNALLDVERKTDDIVKNNVRFYLRAKTPTNYVNEGIRLKSDLRKHNGTAHIKIPVILIFNKNIINYSDDFMFVDGNAGRKEWKACDIASYLRSFNWKYVFYDKENKKQHESWKNIRRWQCAELLYPDFISTDNIKNIVFRTKIDMLRAIQILGNDVRFKVDSSYFYNHRFYLSEYNFLIEKDSFIIDFSYNIHADIQSRLSEYEHKMEFYNGKTKLFEDNFILPNNCNGKYTHKIPILKGFNMFKYYIDDALCVESLIND